MSVLVCPSGKRAYEERPEAEEARHGIRGRRNGCEVYVYRCPDCGKYHLARHRKLGKPLPRR